MLSWSWLLLLSLVACAATEKARYDDYRVFRVVPATQQQLEFIAGLENKFEKIDFWKQISLVNESVDIMMAPDEQESFMRFLENQGMNFSVLVDNVQQLIENELPIEDRMMKHRSFWRKYHNIEGVYNWLDHLIATFPNVVTSVVGGKTHESRQIRGVRISHKEGNLAVVIEAGIHAREWISVPVAMYIQNSLLNSKNKHMRKIADSFDFYIFPVTNPDGYEYSWTTDRLWRKTRKPYPPCFGADPNRNWDFHWGEAGVNWDPCSNTYPGSKVFSEVETRTMADFLKGLGDKLKVYLSFHSHGKLLMFPYGIKSVVAENYDELLRIAKRAARALRRRFGTVYKVGSVIDRLYPATGSSLQWVTAVLKVRYAFIWELSGGADHRGFDLPTEKIVPTCQETTDSFISIMRDVLAASRAK